MNVVLDKVNTLSTLRREETRTISDIICSFLESEGRKERSDYLKDLFRFTPNLFVVSLTLLLTSTVLYGIMLYKLEKGFLKMSKSKLFPLRAKLQLLLTLKD